MKIFDKIVARNSKPPTCDCFWKKGTNETYFWNKCYDICIGTKDSEPCMCHGDKGRCDFGYHSQASSN